MPAVVDAHSDLLVELAFAEDEHGEPNPLRARWLDQLEQGGVALQVCAIYVEPHQLADGGGLRQALRLARAFHAAVECNADRVYAIERVGDLRAVGDGRTGLLLSLEGADALGSDPWLIDVLAHLGVRMASLTWNDANAFAAGCGADGGLTPLGAQAIDRMRRLGVLVDLAHASEQTFWDVLEHTGGTSVLVSHAACSAVYPHPRNLTDRQLRALAETGGVLGLMPHPLVVDPARPDLDGLLAHVDHAVELVGVRHVGLGGDFLRQIARTLGLPDPAPGIAADAALEGLAGPADYPRLAEALVARGYADADVAALLGGNLLRLLAQTLPAGSA